MLKYCGYEIGKDINHKQYVRLFKLIHKLLSNKELIMLNDNDMYKIAFNNKNKWYY